MKKSRILVYITLFLISFILSSCGGNDGEPREFEPRTLHFKLNHIDRFLNHEEEYQLHVAGVAYPLVKHDDESRAEYSDLFTSKTLENHPTHLVEDINLPCDKVMMLYVTQHSDNSGGLEEAHGDDVDYGLAFPLIYVPADEAIEVLEELNDDISGKFKSAEGTISEDMLATYGSRDIAIAIIFHHPQIMNLNPEYGAQVIHEHILTAPGFNMLVEKIRGMGNHGWYNMVPITDMDGNPLYREKDHKQRFSYQIKDEINDIAGEVMLQVINSIKNDPDFKDQNWHISNGSSSIDASVESQAKLKSSGSVHLKIDKNDFQHGLRTRIESNEGRTATLKFTNHYLVHLSQYIEFYDENDNPIELTDWESKLHWLPDTISEKLETKSKKFLGLISPVQTFVGIPLAFDLFGAYDTEVTITFPENAAYAKLMAGELGTHGRFDSKVIFLGASMTTIFELGIPTFLLATSSGYHEDGKMLREMYSSFGILSGIAKLAFSIIWSESETSIKNLFIKFEKFGYDLVTKMLVQAEIRNFLIKQELISIAEDAEPFVGWGLNAVAITTTAAMLGQSAIESLTAPWIIENRLSLLHDIKVTINHDPENYQFPSAAKSYKVFANFSQTDPRIIENYLPNHTLSDPLTVWFNDIPLGGTVSITTVFYGADHSIVGVSEPKVYSNTSHVGEYYLATELTIKEDIAELSVGSEYRHQEKLSWNEESNKRVWIEADAPEETEANFSAIPSATAIQDLSSISMLSKYGILGYSWHGCREFYDKTQQTWRAACENYLQNISLSEHPEKSSEKNYLSHENNNQGFNSHINYTYGNEQNRIANNYILWGYHAWNASTHERFVEWYVKKSESEPFTDIHNWGTDYRNIFGWNYHSSIYPTYGKFPAVMHQTAVHNSGYMFGISLETRKMYSLKLPDQPYLEGDDVVEAMPVTAYASTIEGMVHNPELLRKPRSIKISHDNIVLVLDDIQELTKDINQNYYHGRIKAFTPQGNPVRYFKTNSINLLDYDPDWEYHDHDYELYLKANRTDLESYFLDFNVDSEGNIYVLQYYKARPDTHNYELNTDMYYLNIYRPTGQLISTTRHFSSDKFVVDAWRNIYSLNYELLKPEVSYDDQSVQPKAEPTISKWVLD